jgi:hypothetical protein
MQFRPLPPGTAAAHLLLANKAADAGGERLYNSECHRSRQGQEATMRTGLAAALLVVLGGVVPSALTSGEPASGHGDEVGIIPAAKIQWRDGPPSLPKGAKFALLEGDPSKPGPFVLRVKMPDAYRIPPHTHGKTERVTVLSGRFYIGMGDRFDEKAGKEMPAGSYGHWAAGMKHFAWVQGETVIQLNGVGPWSIQYVNPADDPRKQK